MLPPPAGCKPGHDAGHAGGAGRSELARCGVRCGGMLHHVSLGTADLDRARAFYDPVMRELGLARTLDVDDAVGYGAGITVFSLNLPADGAPASPGNGVHVAFEVEKREVVAAFHRAALAHGGVSDGEPGLRPEYDPNYYAAFVRDPDGNKIEALTFAAQ
jgi:catechol 2,3-dioxygenase-like lactoylglutathione lyase family enzyme